MAALCYEWRLRHSTTLYSRILVFVARTLVYQLRSQGGSLNWWYSKAMEMRASPDASSTCSWSLRKSRCRWTPAIASGTSDTENSSQIASKSKISSRVSWTWWEPISNQSFRRSNNSQRNRMMGKRTCSQQVSKRTLLLTILASRTSWALNW